MRQRILWTVPATLAGAFVTCLWFSLFNFPGYYQHLPASLFGTIILSVIFLLPSWLFVIAPFVLACKGTLWVYSPRHAWWIGAILGMITWLILCRILDLLVENTFLRNICKTGRIYLLLTCPALVGATIATIISLFQRKHLRSPQPPLPAPPFSTSP